MNFTDETITTTATIEPYGIESTTERIVRTWENGKRGTIRIDYTYKRRSDGENIYLTVEGNGHLPGRRDNAWLWVPGKKASTFSNIHNAKRRLMEEALK